MTAKPEELLRQTRLARRHFDKLERHLSEALGAAPHVEKAGAAARDIPAWRRRRTEFLPAALFTEPAWDMLLALYIAQSAGDDLQGTEGFAHHRRLDKLEAAGLIDRTASACDRQKPFRLTEAGHARMTAMLSSMKSADDV